MDQSMTEIGGWKNNSAPAGWLRRQVRWRPGEAIPGVRKRVGGYFSSRSGTAGRVVDIAEMPLILAYHKNKS
jgi:hypothetical protein